MRYLIFKDNITKQELNSRIEYIRKVFKVYAIKKVLENNNYILLNSVPLTQPDIIFMIGHTGRINNFLKENANQIYESVIIIISCYVKSMENIKKIKDKVIYVPKEYTESIEYYNGYNMGFHITDEELLLFKNRKKLTIINNLEKHLYKVVGGDFNGENI